MAAHVDQDGRLVVQTRHRHTLAQRGRRTTDEERRLVRQRPQQAGERTLRAARAQREVDQVETGGEDLVLGTVQDVERPLAGPGRLDPPAHLAGVEVGEEQRRLSEHALVHAAQRSGGQALAAPSCHKLGFAVELGTREGG